MNAKYALGFAGSQTADERHADRAELLRYINLTAGGPWPTNR